MSEHWLWRLSTPAWIAAAQRELELGARALRSRRTALTHGRRAAGMALNAVLVQLGRSRPAEVCETRWGRSYIDHLRALARTLDADSESATTLRLPLDLATCVHCRDLLAIPVMSPTLVGLGRARDAAARDGLATATEIVAACVALCTAETAVDSPGAT